MICYSCFNILPNLAALAYFLYKNKVKVVKVPACEIYNLSKECFSYFISNISITLYTNFYQILLGIISPAYLAAYALSDKIIRGIVSGNYVFIQIVQVQYLNDESKFINGTWKTIVSLLLLGGGVFIYFLWSGFFLSLFIPYNIFTANFSKTNVIANCCYLVE